MSNIFQHVRDSALDVVVNSGPHVFGTPPGTKTTLQAALGQLNWSSMMPIQPINYSSELSPGSIDIATLVETNLRTNNNSSITPYSLKFDLTENPATETRISFIKLVNSVAPAENTAGNSTSAVTPAGLLAYCNTRISTIPGGDVRYPSGLGTALLATSLDAVPDPTGVVLPTNTTKAMRPKQTVELILTYASSIRATATEAQEGAVKLATEIEVSTSAKWGVITPKNINFKNATTSTRGLFKLASNAVLASNYDNVESWRDCAITPGTFEQFTPTASRFGFVRLTDSVSSTSETTALTAAMGKHLQDTKLSLTGGTITGTLKVDNIESTITYIERTYASFRWVYKTVSSVVKSIDNGLVNPLCALEARPVGSIYITVSNINPTNLFGGRWEKIQGRCLVGAGNGVDELNRKQRFVAGSMGGTFAEVITQENIPTHKHARWGESTVSVEEHCIAYQYNGYGGIIGCNKRVWSDDATKWGYASQYGKNNIGSAKTDRDNYLYYDEPVGKNKPHNNMQPYVVVNIWRRTG